jgi:hypothetical protein
VGRRKEKFHCKLVDEPHRTPLFRSSSFQTRNRVALHDISSFDEEWRERSADISVFTIHHPLSPPAEKIDRNRFRDILHNTFDMTDDILMDRGKPRHGSDSFLPALAVFKAFDRDNDGQVSMLEWVVGLNTYLRGTLDEKIACKSPGMQVPRTPFAHTIDFSSRIQLLFAQR